MARMTLTEQIIQDYAELTRDFNSVHIGGRQRTESEFDGVVAHGFLLLGQLLATLPENAYPIRLTCRFVSPGRPGDTLTTSCSTVPEGQDFDVANEMGTILVEGSICGKIP